MYIIDGIDKTISIILTIIVSMIPPKYADIEPYILPMITHILATIMESCNEIFIPCITLE